MQVYFYVLIVWLLNVRCAEVPVATVGPGGACFLLVTSWKDADLAALVDVNTDRRTDAIVLSSQSSARLLALLAPNPKRTGNIFEQVQLFDLKNEPPISIAVADFNGDSRADYLIVTFDGTKYTAGVFYGGDSSEFIHR